MPLPIYIRQPFLLRLAERDTLRLSHIEAIDDHVRAVLTTGGDLHDRRQHRHHNRHRYTELVPVIAEGKRVVTQRG